MSRRVDTVAKHLIESVVFISKAHVLNHYPLLLPLGLLSPLPIPVPPYPHPLPSTLCVRAVPNHLLLLPGKWIVKLKKNTLPFSLTKDRPYQGRDAHPVSPAIIMPGPTQPSEDSSPNLPSDHNCIERPQVRTAHLSPSTPRTMRKKLNCCLKPQSTGKFVI